MKKWIKEYVSFSQKERIGLLGLLILLGCFVAAPYFLSEPPRPLTSEELEWTNHVKFQQSFNEPDTPIIAESPNGVGNNRRFAFDPNTASPETLRQLGFTEKNIRTLTNYLKKGGRVKTPADFHKIWGMRKELVESLLPYIRIVNEANHDGFQKGKSTRADFQFYPKRIPHTIDINTADQEAWEQLPGIGPVLAVRILKYRDRLGRFESVEDIKKTYGLPDSIYAIIAPFLQLNPDSSASANQVSLTKQLPSINTASEALLIKAGVSKTIAAAIVLYRKQYGLFSQLEDLRKIVFIQTAQYEQLIKQVQL